VAGCTEPDVTFASSDTSFTDEDVPWTFTFPSGWEVATSRSEPDPRLKAGVLSTRVSTVMYPFEGSFPGPNSGGGASAELGPSEAVVEVLRLWYPADEPIAWNPSGTSTTVRSPGMWHDDAQNPGWDFRERRVCLEPKCVWVLEWHGPNASEDVVDQLERIAESVELMPDWADPTSGVGA
jgi:hypothetical protein